MCVSEYVGEKGARSCKNLALPNSAKFYFVLACLQSNVQKVTPNWLNTRSMYITAAQSAEIQQALLRIGVLNSSSYVAYDVRLVGGWSGVEGVERGGAGARACTGCRGARRRSSR